MIEQNIRPYRLAFSTVELLVSLSIASVLTLGLTSAILVASRSLELPEQPVQTQLMADGPLGRIRDAVADAKHIQLDGNRVVLTAGGESSSSQTTYELVDGELYESGEGFTNRSIMQNIESLGLEPLIFTPQVDRLSQVRLENVSAVSVGGRTRIDVPFPSGSMVGDLLLFILAYDSNSDIPPSVDPGWTFLDLNVGDNKTIAMWYKFTESLDEVEVAANWSEGNDAIACVIQFSSVHRLSPVEDNNRAAGEFEGSQKGPAAPAVSVTEPGCLVVQTLLTKKRVLSNNVGGLDAHMVCCYQERSNLAFVCSIRQIGNQTGIVDGNNRYEFSGDAEFVMSAIALRPN